VWYNEVVSETQTDDALRAWLESFPVDKVRAELRVLEAEAGRLEHEIRTRRRLLEAREEFLGIGERADGQVQIRSVDADWNSYLRTSGRSATPKQRATAARIARERVAAAEARERSGALAEAVAAAEATDNEAATAPVALVGPGDQSAKPVSRADKLIYFLSRHRGEQWKLSDIRDRLVEEGLLADTEADTHGLQVTASRLARTGRLERPSAGVYRLAPVAPEGSEG
jgi:hypothetical protein